MTANVAERFLAGRINYERALSMPNSEEAFKLDRMRELLHRLGDPQLEMPIVHVAGTKGKGSTAAMIAAILSASGRRVGLFSSPHIDHVTERMAIDGQPCPADEFHGLVESVRPAAEAMDREGAERDPPEPGPTYFEIITAMALLHFSNRKVAAAVLEVGLGGRLDSTNVCSPCLTIITSISLDHTRQLGDTLAKIAAEKAGIIKPGVTVISGVRDDEPREVIRRAADEAGCRLVELGVDFDCEYHPPRNLELAPSPTIIEFINPRPTKTDTKPRPSDGENIKPRPVHIESIKPRPVVAPMAGRPAPEVRAAASMAGKAAPGVRAVASEISPLPLGEGPGGRAADGYKLSLPGRHQAANAAIALAAVEELHRVGWTIPDDAVQRGLAEVSWPARVEVVSRRPAVVVDAAHNVASIVALLETLDECFRADRRFLIFATTSDKDVEGMLRALHGRFDRVIFTRYSNNPRGVPPEDLRRLYSAIKPRQVVAQEISPLLLGEGPGVRAENSQASDSTGNRYAAAGATDGRGFIPETSPLPLGEGPGVRAAAIEIAPTPADAWSAVCRAARPDDLICITGSFFLAAELRRFIAEKV